MDRDLYLEQQALEQEQADRGVEMYFSSRNRLPPSFGSPEKKTLSCQLQSLNEKIEELQLRVAQQERMQGVKHWGMVILSLPAEKLAVITLNCLWNSQSTRLTGVCMELADHVKQERRMDNIRQTAPDIYSKIKRFKKKINGNSFYKVRDQIKGVDEKWDSSKRLWVGHILLQTCLECTDLFYVQKRKSGQHFVYYLYVDPDALKRVEDSHEDLSLLHPHRMPMVVKPVDWKDRWNGGYLTCMDKESCHTPLLSMNFWMRLPHDSASDFGHHITAVNILQKTEWRINKKLFDVGYHVFHNNLELGEMLRKDPDPIPDKPQDYASNPTAQAAWKEAARQTFRRNDRMMSLRTALLVAFDQAKRYRQYDRFYFVWFLDFRGRMYPRGGAMTPQGAEYCKALLEFKEGHPLGERGYHWLTIHLANCLGFDKLKYAERIKKVHAIKEDIYSWADSPLEYKAWADADSPYMALAAAFEWAAATRSKNPHDYISHLPINMDGTTNGLQHLSALGRDRVGAQATNLCCTENPNDIYRQVAGECNIIIEKDYDEWLAAGAPTVESVRTETCPATIARLRKLIGSANWRGRVNRKVAKRATMTAPLDKI